MAYEPPPWPQIVAHRGDSDRAPENTTLAIERAIDIGVDMVEVDVRLTKDGVPILIHSARLEHTTTGRGLVADHTWQEIRRLDAGVWMGPEFAGERVPSLEQVLDLAKGRVPLNLDFQTPEAVAPGVDAVRDAAMTGDVVVSGCRLDCFDIMAAATNEIATLLNPDDLPAGIDPTETAAVVHSSVDTADVLGAAGINLPHSPVDAAVVASAGKVGLGMWAWVVDDEERVAELIDLGVTAVTTNRPAQMLAVVGSRSAAAAEESDG
ncbi:MAG: glycerophosphodiester phosphodiesterase family protein [Acidimicrobiia bacterium]|nr:MAG: glycerophosphodiester phosphodiesterase family protein [Acidimicrobiia bacterium]